jgi:UDP-N-acetylmuramoyl-L-alanyl-D-glutamate--2,6-diaminopimelate ligase
MGAVSESADHVVVTSDNPRNEDPRHIIRQIVGGMKVEPQTVEDRAAAILLTVKQAAKQDVILLAGKGHETYQEVKGTKFPFIDADHAALALAARATMNRGGE